MTDFLTEYEALATEIAKEARLAEKAFGDRIDALMGAEISEGSSKMATGAATAAGDLTGDRQQATR